MPPGSSAPPTHSGGVTGSPELGPALPQEFSLAPNQPNPFRAGSETTIVYEATDGEFTHPGNVNITVAALNDPPVLDLDGLRALCDEFGIVWIADEVMAGFGRTGQWFAWQNWGAQPDLICFAKGVNSGYVPLGGVVISGEIAAVAAAALYAILKF